MLMLTHHQIRIGTAAPADMAIVREELLKPATI